MKRLKREYPLLVNTILQICFVSSLRRQGSIFPGSRAKPGMTNTALWITLLCILLPHCAHVPKDYREKPTFILPNPIPLLKYHEGKAKATNSIIGEGKIRIKSSHKKFVFDFLLAAHTPSSLRLESSHSLGGTLGILVTNPKEFLYYDIEQKTLYKGKNRIHILPDVFPYELTTKEIVGCVTHTFPLPQDMKNMVFNYDEKENVYKIVFYSNKKKWQILFDPVHHFILEMNMEDLKTASTTMIQYGNFEKIKSNFYFPKIIKLFSPSTKMNFELTFDKIEFPQKISSHFFHLSTPKGVITIQN